MRSDNTETTELVDVIRAAIYSQDSIKQGLGFLSDDCAENEIRIDGHLDLAHIAQAVLRHLCGSGDADLSQMNVKGLIEALSAYPPDLTVTIGEFWKPALQLNEEEHILELCSTDADDE